MSQKADFTSFDPVSPPAAYIGGKRQLAKRICQKIDTIPHSLYAEPFVGMGGVFFRRTAAPRAEFINDRSKDVANLFRILQRHYPQLMDTLRFQITSRSDFERLTVTDPDTLTDLERAARFIYLQRLTFGGKVAGRSFGINYSGSSRFNLTTLAPLLQEVHERLASVVIENLTGKLSSIDTIDQKRCFILIRLIGARKAFMVRNYSAGISSKSWLSASAASKAGSSCQSMTCRKYGPSFRPSILKALT